MIMHFVPLFNVTTISKRLVINKRSEPIRSLPARGRSHATFAIGGWEGRAFKPPFACFIIRGPELRMKVSNTSPTTIILANTRQS
jgi:hypothetical protein